MSLCQYNEGKRLHPQKETEPKITFDSVYLVLSQLLLQELPCI